MIVNWSKGKIRGDSVEGTEFFWEGMHFRVLTINGVSVAASILTGKKTFNVVLLVLNHTNQNIDVVPSRFVLSRESAKPKLLAYIPPQKLADKAARDARISAAWMALAGALAKTTSTTQSYSTGSFSGSLSGFVGSTYVSGGYSGNANSSTTSTTTRPDYQMRNLAIQEGAATIAQGEARAGRIISEAFRANTLIPNRYLSGYVYFSKCDADSLVLQVPIGNYIFAIPFQRNAP